MDAAGFGAAGRVRHHGRRRPLLKVARPMCRARDNLACEAGLAARAVGFRALVILYPSLPSGPLGLTGSATATRHTAFRILAG